MTEIQRRKARGIIIMLATLLASGATLAEGVSLQLRPVSSLQAGQIRDGTLLLAGRVTQAAPHGGFRLRCEGRTATSGPETCRLTGQRSTSHELRVRFDDASWQTDEDGMVTFTPDNSVAFRLVADGDQKIAADSWTVALSATTLH